MLAKVESACLLGMEPQPVHVEVNLSKGMPYFSMVGLPDASVREAKDRVVAALRNSGFEFPTRRVTVNLAPADLKKEGAFFDLPIAIGILLAAELIQPSRWPRCLWVGELALDGGIRAIRGALPLVMGLAQKGWTNLVLPYGNREETAYLKQVQLHPFRHIKEAVRWLESDQSPKSSSLKPWVPEASSGRTDLAEIKGQVAAKRALEIAAAGGHNLLFVGTPGSGKSLLAQALPTIMPEWTLDEALEASQIHSVNGSLPAQGLLSARPFRSPHHTTSSVALIGGGEVPLPGEISLAHRGVLFLDELPEFRRDALEALRQPLEERHVHIRRVRGQALYPAECLVVAAMNPCPCGYRGHPKRECVCSESRVQKYLAKVSGPFLDRIDLQVEVPALQVHELFAEQREPENSATVRGRVELARDRQRQRYSGKSTHRFLNAHLKGRDLKQLCPLDDTSRELLKTAVERLGLSARAFDRIRKVARTIADLDGKAATNETHLAEAIQYRFLDKKPVTEVLPY